MVVAQDPSCGEADGAGGTSCIRCGSAAVTERPGVAARSYRRCRNCGRRYSERKGGVLNRACLPSDIIAFVVFCRLRYRLTLQGLGELLLLRGIEVSHEAVRDCEAKLLPVMDDALRWRRHGTRRRSGASWCADETHLKVRGRRVSLHRAVDRDRNLIDAVLSKHRDLEKAKTRRIQRPERTLGAGAVLPGSASRWVKRSRGVSKPGVFPGRVSRLSATVSRSAWVRLAK